MRRIVYLASLVVVAALSFVFGAYYFGPIADSNQKYINIDSRPLEKLIDELELTCEQIGLGHAVISDGEYTIVFEKIGDQAVLFGLYGDSKPEHLLVWEVTSIMEHEVRCID